MAQNHYGPLITDLLARKGSEGATTPEIISFIQTQIDSARTSDTPDPLQFRDVRDTGWGIRAALTRMWKKREVEKAFEYVERPPRVVVETYADGRTSEREVPVGPMRVYRYYAPQAVPANASIVAITDEQDWYKRTVKQ